MYEAYEYGVVALRMERCAMQKFRESEWSKCICVNKYLRCWVKVRATEKVEYENKLVGRELLG